MSNVPKFQVIAVFLVSVLVALGLLFILTSPFQQPVPTASPLPPVDPCVADPMACYTPYIEPTPTMQVLNPQCGITGEPYYVRLVTASVQPESTPYATYSSPDGRYLFYKEGDDVFIREGEGEGINVGSDSVYSDIVGRVIWSPNSRYVMMTPNSDNHPMLIDAQSGTHQVLTEINQPLDFEGWSPDGNHFIFGGGDYATVNVWSAASGKRVYSTKDNLSEYKWSPDGKWLAYLATYYPDPNNNPVPRTRVTVAAADGSAEYRQEVVDPAETIDYIQFADQPLMWSPDSQFATIHYAVIVQNVYRQNLLVAKADGKFVNFTSDSISNEDFFPITIPPVHWLENTSRFTFERLTQDKHFEWMLYDPTSDQLTTLATDLYKEPFYSSSGQSVGLYTRKDELISIHITTSEHGAEIPLVENAVDAGDPNWSPDERWVAAVWARFENELRKVTLSWMHPDGSERHDLDADFKDVRELRWMVGGNKLAYIAWHGEVGNSIEVVDTASGERQVLASDLGEVENPVYEAENDTLSFWWELADGRYGKDSFAADGTQLEHYFAAGDFERKRQEFWSPDGSTVALKLGALPYRGLYDQLLVLAYPDGRRPMLVRSGLDGLGDPIWSPDSQQVVFTQWVQDSSYRSQPPSLQIVSNEGKTLWYNYDFRLAAIEWTACP